MQRVSNGPFWPLKILVFPKKLLELTKTEGA